MEFAWRRGTWLATYQPQRLASASILILANKQDVPGALASDDIRKVSATKRHRD